MKPEILTKLNDIIALGLTKNSIDIRVTNHTGELFLVVAHVQKNKSDVHPPCTNMAGWIFLDKNNTLEKLDQVIEWMNTLEDVK